MKIVLIGRYNESEVLSGPEKFGKRILFQLFQESNEVVFIDYFFKDHNVSFLQRLFGDKIISQKPDVLKLGLIRILQYLIKERPDIVHIVNLEVFQIPLLILKNILNLRIITTYHGILKREIKSRDLRLNYYRKLKVLMLENLAIKKSDINIFVSKLLQDEFRKTYSIYNKNYSVIHNGLDENFLNDPTNKVFSPSFKLAFYNGTSQNIARGLSELNEILSRINDISIELFIIGDEEGFIKLKENFCINKIKLMSSEKLKEFLIDKHFVIKGPSFDSFSIFCIECMSQGLIPIIHKNVGVSEVIVNYESGFIYNPEDKSSLMDIFDFIKNNQNRLVKISSNAKILAKQFSWKKVVKNYSEVYEKCLKEK